MIKKKDFIIKSNEKLFVDPKGKNSALHSLILITFLNELTV